jgi:RimJ/RimL family protein N-acetyltransferase
MERLLIRYKRITLRHVSEDDLPILTRFASDLEMRGDFSITRLTSPEIVRKRFQETGFSEDRSEKFLISDEHSAVIGDVVHFLAKPYATTRELGWVIYDPVHRQQGYATEAVMALINYLFEAYPIYRLECAVDLTNVPSLRLAERCGFLREGIRRGSLFIKGKYIDDAVFGLIRPDWEAIRNGAVK